MRLLCARQSNRTVLGMIIDAKQQDVLRWRHLAQKPCVGKSEPIAARGPLQAQAVDKDGQRELPAGRAVPDDVVACI